MGRDTYQTTLSVSQLQNPYSQRAYEVMISHTCNMDTNLLQEWNHMVSLEQDTLRARTEDVSREEDQRLFLSHPLDLGHEAGRATAWVLSP